MSTAITHSPANQDRPLLLHPPSQQPSDHRRIRTLLDLLTVEKMDGVDRTMRREDGSNNSRWKVLRERLGLNGIGCCGVATWRCENNDNSSPPEEENGVVQVEFETRQQVGPAERGMNLGAALAAEREFRAAESIGSYGATVRNNNNNNNNNNNDDDNVDINNGGTTPLRVSLMRLLEETTDGRDLERERSKGGEREGNNEGSDTVCCVCMERKKGAALIPCGHTYCRVCSRELWLNRGSCPFATVGFSRSSIFSDFEFSYSPRFF
ncbi:uncharacterized protein LOC110687416 [Chenopodium quinoa]|uniref:uncharacterized protein LOC110687416 n=1 Tax=Chenopodium quinoa TaxID=63459 RepID=UPI000B796EE8|nr:uncharacterized protein LOC110687416 [Chenopodium quinoa]